MTFYRLYFMQNGHIRTSEEFDAENDSAAINQADTLRGDQPAELWSRARFVRKFGVREDAFFGVVASGAAPHLSSAPGTT